MGSMSLDMSGGKEEVQAKKRSDYMVDEAGRSIRVLYPSTELCPSPPKPNSSRTNRKTAGRVYEDDGEGNRVEYSYGHPNRKRKAPSSTLHAMLTRNSKAVKRPNNKGKKEVPATAAATTTGGIGSEDEADDDEEKRPNVDEEEEEEEEEEDDIAFYAGSEGVREESSSSSDESSEDSFGGLF